MQFADGSIAYMRSTENSSDTGILYHRAAGRWYPIFALNLLGMISGQGLDRRETSYDDADIAFEGSQFRVIGPDGIEVKL